MRLLLIAACAAAVGAFGVPALTAVHAASAAECSGESCPPPSGQGGHDCERHKQEQTTS